MGSYPRSVPNTDTTNWSKPVLYWKSWGTAIFQVKCIKNGGQSNGTSNAEREKEKESLRATDFAIIYFMRVRTQTIYIYFACVYPSAKLLSTDVCCQVGSSVLMIEPNGKSTMWLWQGKTRHRGDSASHKNIFILHETAFSNITMLDIVIMRRWPCQWCGVQW